jgi:hypothetical protein
MSSFDESGFLISVITSEHVIVLVDCTVVYQANLANHELVTKLRPKRTGTR